MASFFLSLNMTNMNTRRWWLGRDWEDES